MDIQVRTSYHWPRKSPAVPIFPWSPTLTLSQDFYNPINDSFSEPYGPGISYSFTKTHYESAIYRAIANATNPACPGAILQFQHGTYTIASNNSLMLSPFGVDGRQMLSRPCEGDFSTYERYDQPEVMREWVVSEDKYKKVQRLDLGKWDGEKIQPLYLAYRPPMMLPTGTMNPTEAGATPLATFMPKGDGKKEEKRSLGGEEDSYEARSPQARGEPLNKNAKLYKRTGKLLDRPTGLDYAKVFLWASIGMIGFGGLTLVMGRRPAKPIKVRRAPAARVQLQ